MLNNNKIDLYLHLYYADVSRKIIKTLSEVYSGAVHISLNEDGQNNEEILNLANEHFDEVKYIVVENMGSDQWGFYKNYNTYTTEKEWVLYIHDKKESDNEWLNDIIEPFTERFDKINSLINNNSIGIISSISRKSKIYTNAALNEMIATSGKSAFRHFKRHYETLIWMELLDTVSGINCKDFNKETSFFCAGNIFLIRKDILDKLMKDIIIDDFFEKGYRPDGNVEHAMERFYFILSEGLGFTNKYI